MDYLKKLEETLQIFESETDKIAMIPKLIESISEILSELEREKGELTAGISEIKEINTKVEEESKQIRKFIDNEKESRAEFLSIVKNSILQSSQENMELYNNLSKSMTNNIDITKTEINANMVKHKASLSDEFDNLKGNLKQFESAVHEKTGELMNEITTVKQQISSEIKGVKTFALISIGLSTLMCILFIIQIVM